jgi:3-methylcrotonyl-CoA carboxylase alpha subunit
VWPVKTNAGFLVRCLEHPRFVAGDVDTGFIAAEEDALKQSPSDEAVAAAAPLIAEEATWRFKGRDRGDVWESQIADLFGFRVNAPPGASVVLDVQGQRRPARLAPGKDRRWSCWVDLGAGPLAVKQIPGSRIENRKSRMEVGPDQRLLGYRHLSDEADIVVFDRGLGVEIKPYAAASNATSAGPASDGSLRAPMPGKIVAAPAAAGDTVTKGQPIVVLEAMKMEHALTAPFDGVVESVSVAVGDQVGDGVVLAVVTAAH